MKKTRLVAVILTLVLLLSACAGTPSSSELSGGLVTADTIPEFSGEAYIALKDNVPNFTQQDLVAQSYEFYSPLDALGRCGEVMACVGVDIMPTEERGSIGQVKPSGWQTVKYDHVDGKYLYNRCHLIGFQLTGENANEQNLITGTRYLNIEGMLPFENMVADYVKETENHVAFRVTPVFEGNNMLATGVLMEAQSVEDGGEDICFAVFCYNVQPGIVINYITGESALSGEELPETPAAEQGTTLYVLNTSSKRIHRPECSSVTDMAEHNKQETYETIASLQNKGYTACGSCKPE